MLKFIVFSWLSLLLMVMANHAYCQDNIVISSPDDRLTLEFILTAGVPQYRVMSGAYQVIAPSRLGFEFNRQRSMTNNFRLLSSSQREVNERWRKVWGQSEFADNHFRELVVNLAENTSLKRQLTLIFRVYDDGVGFRYLLPEQPNLTQFAITAEKTEFTLSDNHSSWWIPADFDSYEALYRNTPLAEVTAVNTPMTLTTNDGLYLSIHEAALTDYAGMTLKKEDDNPYRLHSDLVPWPDGIKVKGQTPFNTPWRTIQVAHSVSELLESDLIVNLNEPSVIDDTSWITPMKYVGIWWGMHMRQYTWHAGPNHGATTENTKAYIDFAKQHNIGGVLVEGWNKGWETWHTGLNVQDFTQAYQDFNLQELAKYARENGVALIGHHETGGNIPAYEQQMAAAFKLYHDVGVTAVKTGYAGEMKPEGIYHHGQYMVNHYRKVLELAAKYKIMVNAHEPIKPTGIRRTYPNMMTREGGRGMEWNGWSEGNSPEHTVTLPFTRLLAGPMDYTPGIFNIQFDLQRQYRVHTTLAKQLAMYVTLYSPVQMAADMIENYHHQPAFEFIEQVPASWQESKVLAGDIGEHIVVARRNGKRWFLGAMTDEQPRLLNIKLDFLSDDVTYVARVFSDAKSTDYYQNPVAIDIGSFTVEKGQQLTIAMAGTGGQAIYFTPASERQIKLLPHLTQHNELSVQNFEVFQSARRYGEIEQITHLAVNKPVTLLGEYDQGYAGGGDNALVDGQLGLSDYKNLWQGYREKDLDIIIDLESVQSVSSIDIGFLQSVLHSILLPSQVTFAVSSDGKSYHAVGQQNYHTLESVPDYQRKTFSANFAPVKTRFIRVTATNLAQLPSWHQRPGQECFIFADEIIVH